MTTLTNIMHEVATAHGMTAQALADSIKAAGWDMAAIGDRAGEPVVADLIRKVATGHAETMVKTAERKAQIAARAEAQRLACMTVEAKANPQFACTRCDGKGKVRGFSHIERGVCFACNGRGVRISRRSK